MYAGYILVYAGFLLNNPLWWNLGVYFATMLCLIARILAEEKVLAKDADYADFMTRVRYRLAPGLF
jgi:protein-S-isoprenylcysteine O-methyltransferase Ste14